MSDDGCTYIRDSDGCAEYAKAFEIKSAVSTDTDRANLCKLFILVYNCFSYTLSIIIYLNLFVQRTMPDNYISSLL